MRKHSAMIMAVVAALLAGMAVSCAPEIPDSPEFESQSPRISSSETQGSTSSALPSFEFVAEVTPPELRNYDPTGEVIFPSVVRAGDMFASPLAEWYLYYAPHDNPGGISLMYADVLEGPWTPFENNPIVTNEWDEHYEVSHVSSADVVWNDADQLAYMYFHGENSTMRWATSSDGVSWDYGGVAFHAGDIDGPGAPSTESSYGRVFVNPNPDADEDAAWAMLFMDNTEANERRIRLAHSADGKSWTVHDEPLLTATGEEGLNLSSADLWIVDDRHYIVYHSALGVISARETDASMTSIGEPEILYAPSEEGVDVDRAAAPEIVEFDGKLYLFYEVGDRHDSTIALAVAEVR